MSNDPNLPGVHLEPEDPADLRPSVVKAALWGAVVAGLIYAIGYVFAGALACMILWAYQADLPWSWPSIGVGSLVVAVLFLAGGALVGSMSAGWRRKEDATFRKHPHVARPEGS